MTEQLDLFEAPIGTWEELRAQPCSWFEGVPDRSGVAKYTHCLRSPFDPDRLSRAQRHREGGGFEAWRSDLGGEPRQWAARIVRHLRSLRDSRTFNGLVLELTGYQYTADVALDEAPDHGLWLAVERGLVYWSNDAEPGVVRFAAKHC